VTLFSAGRGRCHAESESKATELSGADQDDRNRGVQAELDRQAIAMAKDEVQLDQREVNLAEGESALAQREELYLRREQAVARRELAAEERERLADERETAANERENVADQRERAADERETLADRRERAGDEREARLDALERELDERARNAGRSRRSRSGCGRPSSEGMDCWPPARQGWIAARPRWIAPVTVTIANNERSSGKKPLASGSSTGRWRLPSTPWTPRR